MTKKMTFRTYYNSKSVKLIPAIIKTEQLEVSIKVFTDALGDDIIEVSGNREEVQTLKEIFESVA